MGEKGVRMQKVVSKSIHIYIYNEVSIHSLIKDSKTDSRTDSRRNSRRNSRRSSSPIFWMMIDTDYCCYMLVLIGNRREKRI